MDFSVLALIRRIESTKFFDAFSFAIDVNSFLLPCFTERSKGTLPTQRRLNTDLRSFVFLMVFLVTATRSAITRHTASAAAQPIFIDEP